MPKHPAVAMALSSLVGALCACQPAPKSAASAAPSGVVAHASTAPAKKATMVCRNSQNGRSVACGTPNAVLVGVKTD